MTKNDQKQMAGFNLVEMIADEYHDSPCRHGNIVDGHACYCHHPDGPRKCPIWRNFGEDETKWHNRGDFDSENWTGGCRFFEPTNNQNEEA